MFIDFSAIWLDCWNYDDFKQRLTAVGFQNGLLQISTVDTQSKGKYCKRKFGMFDMATLHSRRESFESINIVHDVLGNPHLYALLTEGKVGEKCSLPKPAPFYYRVD